MKTNGCFTFGCENNQTTIKPYFTTIIWIINFSLLVFNANNSVVDNFLTEKSGQKIFGK